MLIAGLEEGLFPTHARARTKRSSRRTGLLVGRAREAQLVLRGAPGAARVRRIPATQPSRLLDEIQRARRSITPAFCGPHQGGFAHGHYEFRTTPTAVRPRGRVRDGQSSYAYENEDQSAPGLKAGMRVRHAQFGVGSVISVEEHNDDLKITVRFNLVCVKKLLAKYAKLELA